MLSPVIRHLPSNGLEYRVLDWAPPDWGAIALLVHGYLDAAATWDLVVPALLDAKFRVIAPDLRGFGHGARVPSGAYYHFPDYVFDIADLVDAEVKEAPLYLVGHSMGGTVATLYAGAFPERVTKLALLEGVGPPDNPPEVAPIRMRRWIDQVRAVRTKEALPRAIGTHEDAFRRLKSNHATVDSAVLRERLPHLVRPLAGDTIAWANDPLHKTISPSPFFATVFCAFAAKITCPVLHVSGGATGYHPPDEEARLAAFAQLSRVEIEGAGHMMHWTKPAELARSLVSFWQQPAPPA